MNTIFKDDKLNTSFVQEGYCHIPGLVNQAEIAKLYKVFTEFAENNNIQGSFYTTHWLESEQARRDIHTGVTEILLPLVNKYLNNYKSIFGYFLVKKPHGANATTIHQDWSLTDETKYTGINLWCPLTDTNKANGNFEVVKGSHRIYNKPRGTNIPSPFNTFGDNIEKFALTPVEAKAGDAILFDHRLLHASPPNLTDNVRVAAGLVLLPEVSPVIHHLREGDNLYIYEADDNFLVTSYFNYLQPSETVFKRENYKLLATMTFQDNSSNLQEFEELYNNLNNK